MKKISTAAAKQIRDCFSAEADDRFGSRRSIELYCVLDGAGEIVLEQTLSTSPKSYEGSVRAHRAVGLPWKRGCTCPGSAEC